MGAGRFRIPGSLQEHDPAGGRAAAAVLVLRAASPAVPVFPPDPLEVVYLEHEEGDDPEENLGARHVVTLSAPIWRLQWARRPNLHSRGSYERGTDAGRSRPRRNRSAPNGSLRAARRGRGRR